MESHSGWHTVVQPAVLRTLGLTQTPKSPIPAPSRPDSDWAGKKLVAGIFPIPIGLGSVKFPGFCPRFPRRFGRRREDREIGNPDFAGMGGFGIPEIPGNFAGNGRIHRVAGASGISESGSH